MTFNEILIRRKGLALLPSIIPGKTVEEEHTATIQQEFLRLGEVLTPELVEELSALSLDQLKQWFLETVKVVKDMKGDRDYQPMYPNFPEQVMEMDNIDLVVNAIIHYWTLALPAYEKNERLPLFEQTKVHPIGYGTILDLQEVMHKLMSSKSSLSIEDVDDLKEWLEQTKDYGNAIPEAIPHKEIMALVSSSLFRQGRMQELKPLFKTATDVLRFIVGLSGGDVSLAEKTKFRKFNRPERRVLMELLEDVNPHIDDMWLHRGKWLRIGEILHPGEYKKYIFTQQKFKQLRNDKVITFNSSVESFIKDKDLSSACNLLSQKPGLFVRRIAELAHMATDKLGLTLINTYFYEIADKVSTPVLLQLKAFLQQDFGMYRAFMPKGNTAKVQVILNEQEQLPKDFVKGIVDIIDDTLAEKFSERESLGNIYLDKELQNYTVPLTQRNASKALHTIARGSKLSISKKNTIRFFIWWKDGKERTDIDLSATFFDKDWNYKSHISYTNLKDNNLKTYHSGDITSAPEGASEFIDIDLQTALDKGIRYIVPNVYSFTSQPYCALPECFMGWMEREEVQSGEIYDPRTVAQKIDLASDTTIAIPMLIDLVDGSIKWLDLSLTKQMNYQNNLEANGSNVAKLAYAMNEKEFPNLYELLELHARGRGQIVDDEEKADIVFSVKENTPYDIETILADFL